MAIVVADAAFTFPGGEPLFVEVSFKVDTGTHVALIGDNGTGKSTLLRCIAGLLEPETGTVAVDGDVRYMPQSIGQVDAPVDVRTFLASLGSPRERRAAAALEAAERANEETPTPETGLRLAEAHAEWADVHGYELEALWDAATSRVLRQPLSVAGGRPVTELSGGERKRLALEILLDGDADALLLDEPDNFLDIPAKRWLEEQIRASDKTILLISHDRELLSRAVTRIVTLEGLGTWVHGGSFAGYHEVRDARHARLGDAQERWKEEERRLYRHYKLLKQRAAVSDANAPRADAAETRWRRFVAAGPPPAPPPPQRVSMRLRGADSGRRVVRCRSLELAGLTDPFSIEVFFGERVAVLGPNGSGKSHFVRLLGGEPVAHAGGWTLGARVAPGTFIQTNERPDFAGRTAGEAIARYAGSDEALMRALARYGLQATVGQRYETLSGGQQARLQVLALELDGANLLLLDEPTDNLDLVSAEALQEALEEFVGTVVAVTHDRWFMRSFDRFVIFGLDGSVTEALDFESALSVVAGEGDASPGSLVPLGEADRSG
jgi:ATPase subunit of ABC transporter with duplicated ATPase domains